MRNKRRLTMVAGILSVAAVVLVAMGLLFKFEPLKNLFRGTSVSVGEQDDPLVIPAPGMDKGARQPVSGPAEVSPGTELAIAPVTWLGGLEGWCQVWGTDPDHPEGTMYYAGTLKMSVEGQDLPGYCIDLSRGLTRGETYDGRIYLGSDPALCPVYWIMANYRHDNPAEGLSNHEEGAAIQAALWYFVSDFQPVWDPNYWCGQEPVYQRAIEIVQAAENSCLPVPTGLTLTSEATQLQAGENAQVLATVSDQQSRPVPEHEVRFESTSETSGTTVVRTNAQGQAAFQVPAAPEGTAQVTARIEGLFPIAIVDDVSGVRQRVAVLKIVPYDDAAELDLSWDTPNPPSTAEHFRVFVPLVQR